MTSISHLPNEVLLLIFQNVPNKKELTLTCRRWNVLVGPTLHLNINVAYSSNIDKILKLDFLRPYQHLKITVLMRTDYHWIGQLNPTKRARSETDPYELILKCLELIRQLEPHLTDLSLSFGPMDDKIVTAFLPRGPGHCRLETLKITFISCYLAQPKDGDINQVLALVANNDKAEVVEMPHLRKFHYGDGRSSGDRTSRRKLFDTIVRKAKGITEISLDCPHYPCFPDFRIMRSFANQLQHVSCVIWPFFTEDFFQLTFPRAKSMDLSFGSRRRAPDTVANFFANALCLTDLTVENVRNPGFYRQCVAKCSQLKKLTINDDHDIPIDAIQNLCRLKELHLHSSDESIEQNVVPCSQTLEKLVLERSTIGLPFYRMLAINIPYVVELHISEDRQFNSKCLQAVCSSLVNLRRLKLILMSYVEDPVTHRGFQNIDRLGKLEYLYLESFDDDYFSTRTVPFATLFTNWVQKVTAPQIHLKDFRKFNLNTLLNFMLNPNLKELVLDSCGDDHRLEDGLKKLRQLQNGIPNVRIIHGD